MIDSRTQSGRSVVVVAVADRDHSGHDDDLLRLSRDCGQPLGALD